ncbi:2-phosphosulfolactate phosphatase [Legionella cardiaca]|uniref:Probable 2-phosphosulfolactate phosphatase n=1 Tax=Legionella cardiaca TaxID=1071983 RepID=A0ABY8AUB7_9GAMM|nr:2-phosphosulfolactate phosphatase [Legionella cardiaca]WED44270.1 2-phosphosulfolactate phosphatase [Legionella cardiaca]
MSVLVVEFLLGVTGAKIAAKRNHTVVVIDVLRASSTIVTLLDKGVQAIKPVESIHHWDGLIIGEEDGQRINGCHLNNSPTEVKEMSFNRHEVVAIKTTNGSACIMASKSINNHVLIGSALNAKASAALASSIAIHNGGFISIVLAGWRGQIALDDLYIASLIFDNIPHKKLLTGVIKYQGVDDLYSAMIGTEAAKRLHKLGYEKDILTCAQQDVTQTVPYYDGELIRSWHPTGDN